MGPMTCLQNRSTLSLPHARIEISVGVMGHDFCEIVTHKVVAPLVEEFLDIGGHLHRLVLARLVLEGIENGLQILSYPPA